MKRKAAPQKKAFNKKKVDPLDHWKIEGRYKMNTKRDDQRVPATTFTNVASTSAVLMNTIASGNTEFTRVGDRVRIMSVQVHGFISTIAQPTNATTYANDFLRIIFFYDRQPNGNLTTFGDVVQNNSTGATTADGPPNFPQRGRYKILRDFQIPVPNITLGPVAAPIIEQCGCIPTSKEFNLKFYKNCKGKLETMYTGINGTIGSITAGALLMVYQCFQPGSPWQIQFTHSTEYMDV